MTLMTQMTVLSISFSVHEERLAGKELRIIFTTVSSAARDADKARRIVEEFIKDSTT
jgi:hypothetical protein